MGWALTSIIPGDGAAAVELSIPEEEVYDTTTCQSQNVLGNEAVRKVYLPTREGSFELTSSNSIKGAAYIGCHALALGLVTAASARGNLPSLLITRIPERSMASAMLEVLKTLATEVERSQIEDAVGSSSSGSERGPPGKRDKESSG